jgi:hypothetical protein
MPRSMPVLPIALPQALSAAPLAPAIPFGVAPDLGLAGLGPAWLGPAEMGGAKAAVAVAGALLLGFGALRRSRGRPAGRGFDALLAGLGVLAAACWWNLGRFHYPSFGHLSETYHYYVGSKYFPELGYTNLYRCTALADAESRRGAEVEARYARDLGTNRIAPAAELLRDPQVCQRRFSPARWRAFRRDVAFFRERLPAPRWARTQVDHGYNATPAWGLLGGLLARTGPATERRILLLWLLDPLLLLSAGAAIAWAFGWRTLCVAALYWGTNYPAQYGWVGGSYLRQLELAALLVGIACLRRGRPAAGGALLAVSSLVRVYPAVAFAGVGLRALWDVVPRGAAGATTRGARRRLWLEPAHRRFLLAALATAAITLPLSGAAAGGLSAWREFAERSRVLLETPLRNHMGLRTLLAWDPAATARALEDRTLDDAYGPWKQARRRSFEVRRPVFLACVAGFAVLLALAVRREEDWAATVLALGLVPIALELTCYYSVVLVAYALLWERHPWVGAALCALSASGWWIADRWLYYDEIFTWLSLASALFVVFATAASLATRRAGPSASTPGEARPSSQPRPTPEGRPSTIWSRYSEMPSALRPSKRYSVSASLMRVTSMRPSGSARRLRSGISESTRPSSA